MPVIHPTRTPSGLYVSVKGKRPHAHHNMVLGGKGVLLASPHLGATISPSQGIYARQDQGPPVRPVQIDYRAESPQKEIR
eukprot:56126-Eustigmatos_ZCMA.PRE.1